MKRVLSLITICLGLVSIAACKKKTVFEVVSPVDTLSKIGGVKQWHGQYSYQEYNSDSTHIDYIESDTSISFALTILNDSTISYEIGQNIDTLHYERTYEPFEAIFYGGNSALHSTSAVFYYYSSGKVVFSTSQLDSFGLNTTLTLATPI